MILNIKQCECLCFRGRKSVENIIWHRFTSLLREIIAQKKSATNRAEIIEANAGIRATEFPEERRNMARTKPLGVYAERKDLISRKIRGRIAESGLRPADIFRRKVIDRSTYYHRLGDAGTLRLEEIWRMEAAGVKFTNEDLLAMFGR